MKHPFIMPYDKRKWRRGEIREYKPIAGGCFLCLKHFNMDCRFGRTKDEMADSRRAGRGISIIQEN